LLYNVKLGIEDTRLAFSQGAASDAKLLIQFANRRIEEIEALADEKHVDDIEIALSGYDEILSQIIDLSEEDELANETETLDKIHFGLDHHQEVLQRILQRTQEQTSRAVIQGLQNALEKSMHGKAVIETLRQGGSPSDLAPGQQDKEKENQGGPPEDHGRGNDPDRTPGPPPSKTPKDRDNNDDTILPPTKTPKPKD
jgi:hypothetical protein